MPRAQSPDVRRALIDRAASRLARREPVTLASLVKACGVSTMAVYTYFDGMPGLWSAVRQEGFTRLAERLATVRPGRDPVRHVAALGVAYAENALVNPDLYRVMFDSTFEIIDPASAAASFELLVDATRRAQGAGRFDPALDPGDVAMQYWATGHGLTSLTVTGVLSAADLRRHAPAAAAAIFTAAGDAADRARSSVDAAWRARPATKPPWSTRAERRTGRGARSGATR